MSGEPEQLMMMASIPDIVRGHKPLPAGFSVRPITREDEPRLAEIYQDAYTDQHAPDAVAARHELSVTYAGEYGALHLSASPAIERDGRIVAAVMVVDRAPWPGSPPGPFVIEVMTDRSSRRLGLAEYAVVRAAQVLGEQGAETMPLFVMSANTPARRLYEKLGFRIWPG